MDAALTGTIVNDDYTTVDATRKQASCQALAVFHRELWEQTAPAVQEALA